MIFVDTGAWYASIVPDDSDHESARDWLDQNAEPLLTTDYIIDEALTLLKMRGHSALALELGRLLFEGELAKIALISEVDIQEAWRIFREYTDKGWSFTDCTSKAVIDRLKIGTAFAFDLHFRQFGSVKVVP
jgi:predicted nucleic acid-binding protein